MASRNRCILALCVVAIVCLLVVSNWSQIAAEATKDADHSGTMEAVEDAAEDEDGADYAGDAGGVVEDDDDDDENEEEEDDDDDGENGAGKEFDETDVVVLGSNNFTAFVTTSRYVMVEFYAPWCGHCQELAPQWAAAATALKGIVAVAKVDATAHPDISETFGVASYPTLFFFVDGGHSPYAGERTK